MGSLQDRARGLGVPTVEADGLDAREMTEAVGPAIQRARSGGGPTFLQASCVHFEGNFLGLPLLRMVREPLREIPGIAVPLTKSLLKSGGGALRERAAGIKDVVAAVLSTLRDPRRETANDPVLRARQALLSDPERLQELEAEAEREINQALASVSGERLS
ncbi:MAG: hypothetical protein JSV89_13020 [Spirochaetaceae bacterium]|nr:MAG: hypothetical protein JSV89_13020 [Spirochaetaceae bacterium]